jgi:hypothetical protein
MTKAAATIAIMVLALVCSSCGSGQHYADPSCPAVLAQVSTVPPADSRQATHEIDDLQALAPPGTTLGTLTNRVVSDLENMFGSSSSGSEQAQYDQYVADAARIQHYCTS